MTFHALRPHSRTFGLDGEARDALADLGRRAAALAPFVRPALMIRLQLAAILAAYLLSALAIAAGLLPLIGRL